MSDAPPPAGTAPTAKKKTSGCLIAFLVGLGILVLTVVVVGVVGWRFMKTPEGQAVADTLASAAGAASAPGTAQLNAQLGCAPSAVLDMTKMARLAMGDAGPGAVDLAAWVVTCVKPDDKAITCDDVVKTYFAAVPTGPQVIHVQVVGKGKANLCEGDFDRTGAPVAR
jgi:hypothetical protein